MWKIKIVTSLRCDDMIFLVKGEILVFDQYLCNEKNYLTLNCKEFFTWLIW